METKTPPWPSRPALFLDLDGTLLQIAEHPDRVAPSWRLRELLPHLPEATGGAVALISGRRIGELDRLLAPHVFAAAGVHGLERRDGRGRGQSFGSNGSHLRDARRDLELFAASHPGLLLEDKLLSAALHYRARPDLEPAVMRFADELEARLPPGLEVLHGQKVIEIKPSGMDKGQAIRAFMTEPPFAGRTAVFVGDDLTDEAGFRAVNALGGVSVKVNSGPTEAHWRLADVDAVLQWLEDAIAVNTED